MACDERKDTVTGRVPENGRDAGTREKRNGENRNGAGPPGRERGCARLGEGETRAAVRGAPFGGRVHGGGAGGAVGQNWSSRVPGPVYSWAGRPMRRSGAVAASVQWAIQPGARPTANSAVNISTGKPMAR